MCLFGSSRTAFTLCGSQEPFSFQPHSTIQVVWSWAACEIHHREEIAQGTKEQASSAQTRLSEAASGHFLLHHFVDKEVWEM